MTGVEALRALATSPHVMSNGTDLQITLKVQEAGRPSEVYGGSRLDTVERHAVVYHGRRKRSSRVDSGYSRSKEAQRCAAAVVSLIVPGPSNGTGEGPGGETGSAKSKGDTAPDWTRGLIAMEGARKR